MDKKVIDHFKKTDKILHSIIHKIAALEKWEKKHHQDYFIESCANIIGQQLSGKAADTIFARFEKLFKGKRISPENILEIPDQNLRDVGMSWSKVKYVKDLAEKVKNETLQLAKLDKLSDNEVINELTKIKGIGPWTAEMFLMFTLGREDVFSYGDLGLKNAIKKLYKFKNDPLRKQIESIVKKWSPYKTYASRILWKSLEIK